MQLYRITRKHLRCKYYVSRGINIVELKKILNAGIRTYLFPHFVLYLPFIYLFQICNAGLYFTPCNSTLFFEDELFSETLLNSVQLGLRNGQPARILLFSDMSLLQWVIRSRIYERKYCLFSRIYKVLSFPLNVGIRFLVDVALHTRKTEQ